MLCPNYNAVTSLNLLKDKGSAATMAKDGRHNFAVLTVEGKSFPSSPKVLVNLPFPSNVSAAYCRQTASIYNGEKNAY